MSIHQIKRLAETNACLSLKLANYLVEDHLYQLQPPYPSFPFLKITFIHPFIQLYPNHYGKIDIASVLSLLNPYVAAAIRTLVHVGNTEEVLTTAWFLELIFKWLKLMTSRPRSLAMSEPSIAKHEDAIAFLEDVVALFGKITIQKPGECSSWKPVQTSALLAIQSSLQLQDLYLKTYDFKVFFLIWAQPRCSGTFFSVV